MSSIGAIGTDPTMQTWAAQQAQLAQQAQGQGQDPQARQQAIDNALKSSGVDPSKVPQLQSQIESAVQQALQSNSGSPAQARQAATAAVDNILKQNGVDPDKFRSSIESDRASHAKGGHKGHRTGGGGKGQKTPTVTNGIPVNATEQAEETLTTGSPLPGGTIDQNA